MPANKHKRKATTQSKGKHQSNSVVKSSGLISSHPTIFIFLGFIFIAVGIYLLIAENQDNSIFGLAMLLIFSGAATAIYANFSLPTKNK